MIESRTDELIVKLASTITDSDMFNPYNQICKIYDLNTAPGIRQSNLRIYLDRLHLTKPTSIFINETSEFFGAKLTGVPMIDPKEKNVIKSILNEDPQFESSNKANFANKEIDKHYENVWKYTEKHSDSPLIWYLIPFYPHNEEDITKKRKPSKEEYEKYSEFLKIILSIFKPKKVYARTQEVEKVLSSLKIRSKLL